MDTINEQNGGWRQKFALLALGLAIFTVLWFGVAALGTKFGLWGWQFGLGKMTIGWGPKLGIAALSIAGLALIVSLIKAPRKQPFILSLAALLIAGGTMGRLSAFGAQAAALPPIHDVQTNWDNPIQFSTALLDIRKATGAMNPVEDAPVIPEGVEARWPGYGGKSVAEAQAGAEQNPAEGGEDDKEKLYPPLNTTYIDKPKAMVFAAARELIAERGWDLVTVDADAGVLEATHTSGWFEFKDDVALRIGEDAAGSTVVDMRSISRVGLSDLGANAKRVGNFLTDLKRKTAG